MVWATVGAAVGCGAGAARIHPPSVDPSSAAEEAIVLYDSDSDGALNEAEYSKCPAFVKHLAQYDANGDGSIDRDEIEARITDLRRRRVALTPLRAIVILDGRTLPGANVVLEPEPFLGDSVKQANGTTNAQGVAKMQIAAEDLPEGQQGIRAVHVGSFKIRVTHPDKDIPDKYNVNTELGYETLFGSPSVHIRLSTKR